MALAEQPDLPLFQINVIQVHAHKLRQTHAAVQEQDHHAVIPLREIALGLGAFQQIHGLFCSQVFGQDLVLFGRFDRSGRVGIQPVDLIDQIIIKAVETGQPPGSRGLFVAAFPVEEIQVFVDIFFGHAGPECRVQSFGVDVLHLAVCRNKAAAALHKAEPVCHKLGQAIAANADHTENAQRHRTAHGKHSRLHCIAQLDRTAENRAGVHKILRDQVNIPLFA